MDWVHQNIQNDPSIWIGLWQDTTDPAYSEPSGAWKWDDGSPLIFTNWGSGEPSNSASGEETAFMNANGHWIDHPEHHQDNAVIEVVSIDCDGNGLPDCYEIALNPTLDSNGDGLLDGCAPILTWTQRPGTSSWYSENPHPTSWTAHRVISELSGVHLAIIEDSTEDAWVSNQFYTGQHHWFGLFQDLTDPQYSEAHGGWKWVDGSTLQYSNWEVGEPNNSSGYQDFGLLYSHGNWDDHWNTPSPYAAIYECDSDDCDDNLLPDTYEIALNPGLDLNNDGLLDNCTTLTWLNRPGTTQWYATLNDLLTWEEHRSNAELFGGHLAVIEDQSENDWLTATYTFPASCWIGLWQDFADPTYSEPDGGWKWVNADLVSYENWAVGEPSNGGGGKPAGGQMYGVFLFQHSGPPTSPNTPGKWNDYGQEVDQKEALYELTSVDCDGDLIPDTYEIALDPSLDVNNDGFIDSCLDLTWIQRPETDQWYGITAHQADWISSREVGQRVGGYLVVFDTPEENAWISALGLSNSLHYYIGLYQDKDDPLYSEPSGGWKWIDGSALSFQNWGPSQPFDAGGEDVGALYPAGGLGWHDQNPSLPFHSIVECTSIDCDGDLIPDTYEIALDGSLDSNRDGSLDSCLGGGPYTWDEDCNGNGIFDLFEVSMGMSRDANGDGRPDECNPHAQVVFEFNGEGSSPYGRVAVLDDLDLDGTPDFAITEPIYDTSAYASAGRVSFYSGATGDVFHTIDGFRDGMRLGTAIDGGADIDGDGIGDILIGGAGFTVTVGGPGGAQLPDAGIVYVLSGVNFSLIHVHYGAHANDEMGTAVSFLPDWDGDDIAEYAIGSPFAQSLFGGNGLVEIFSGATGFPVTEFSGAPGAPSNFGMALATGGDADGGGASDLLVGAPSQGAGGEAILISSETRAELAVIPSAGPVSLTGQALAFLGDQDGDGRSEFAVGSPRYDLATGETDAGRVGIWSFANDSLTELASATGAETSEGFGFRLCPIRDITGSSFPDLLIGAPGVDNLSQPVGVGTDAGAVYTYSLSGGALNRVATMPGTRSGDRFGELLSRRALEVGPGNGPRYLAGAYYGGANGLGYAMLVNASLPPLGSYYCEGAATSSPYRASISAFGSTNTSSTTHGLRLLATGVPENQFGIFFYGTNGIQLPFGDGFRCVGGAVNRLPVMNAGADGRMQLDVSYPNTPIGWTIQSGMTRHFQCWFRDTPAGPGHFNLSDAVTLTFQ